MKYVLFVCNHNAGRSQMAQAFFDRITPEDIRAESAGSSPASQVWPTAVEVMREVGRDIRACADAVLARYDDVAVRGHILTLAQRRVRECLSRETCDALAAV
jgi:protein-tyrosine-phosphatase